MFRYWYTILSNLIRLMECVKTMGDMAVKPAEENCEEYNYGYVRYVIDVMRNSGKIDVEVFGKENLPEEGGYMMYPNHQGKWDLYSIISGHKKPLTFVMDIKKSNAVFIKQLVDVLHGKRLDKENNRQAMTIINEVAEEVAAGRRCVLFPEGMFDKEKKNNLYEFKSGCFKISLKSKTPIVPVVLIDSYRAYNTWHVGNLKTQVHFLKPILFEEYKDMNTKEIAEMVKSKIQEKIEEVTGICKV